MQKMCMLLRKCYQVSLEGIRSRYLARMLMSAYCFLTAGRDSTLQLYDNSKDMVELCRVPPQQ